MNNISLNNSRLDYLDAARAFALILGIVFHASISFMPIFIGWAVMDISTSPIVSVFITISHSFRLALFFLIAGFFSHMKFHSEDTKIFLKSRLVRIGIPFVIGWFLLRPLLVSCWIMGAESMRGEASILNGLTAGFATLGDLPKELFVGTHLWFLYYLLLISMSVVLLRYLLGLHKPLQHTLRQLADTTIGCLSRSPFGILAIAVPTAASLWFMSHWGMDTPDKSLVPQAPTFLIYGGAFLFGWLLHRHADLIEHFARLSWSKFALCLLAIVTANMLASYEMQFSKEHFNLIKACFVFSYAVMMWSLVSLTIGLFRELFNRPSKTVRYLADSSYWLYLIHLPIVIWLQIAFAELPLHWSIKLGAICALTILISIVLYDAFIRSTFVGAVLNGKRKARFQLNTYNKT
jgi:glucans biosynthesis protein C